MNHDRIAPVYDLLARLWTGGGILRASTVIADHVRPGDRVLMAGVGGGRDAALLAGRGAHLTLVDLSPRMLERAATRVFETNPGARVRLVQGDALSADLPPHDVVCAHYFLNLWDLQGATEALRALRRHLVQGGLLSIADFRPPPPRAGLLQRVHYAVPAKVFSVLGLCAAHPVHDYGPLLAPQGLQPLRTRDVPVFGWGPRWHRAWIARAGASPPSP